MFPREGSPRSGLAITPRLSEPNENPEDLGSLSEKALIGSQTAHGRHEQAQLGDDLT